MEYLRATHEEMELCESSIENELVNKGRNV